MRKILYFDVETTGLEPGYNEITQFAAIIEINGNIAEEINLNACPDHLDRVTDEALTVTGKTIDDLKAGITQTELYKTIVKLFDKYIDKYNRSDKFIYAGHNVKSFDILFLNAMFKEHGNNYLFSYMGNFIDSYAIISGLSAMCILPAAKDNKLETACNYYDIEIDNAHDALSDIRANRHLIHKIREQLAR